MENLYNTVFLVSLLVFYEMAEVYSRGPIYTPPDVERLTDHFSRTLINQSYTVSFGGSNVRVTNNGTSVDLSLDKISGYHDIYMYICIYQWLLLFTFIL